jgi:hypothetical protein
MTTLKDIRAQLKPYQDQLNTRKLRDILERGCQEPIEDSLTAEDLFILMTKEENPKRMYKLAKLYVILVEEDFGKNDY